MIIGMQIVGLLFGLTMLYVTFLYFRRKDYKKEDFIIWAFVWLFFIFMVMFPQTVYGIMETLKIQRTVDFFVIGGFLFFSVMIFYLYITVRRLKLKLEKLVRKSAIDDYEKREKDGTER